MVAMSVFFSSFPILPKNGFKNMSADKVLIPFVDYLFTKLLFILQIIF